MQSVASLLDPQVTATLQRGGVCVIPTDTVYGIVCVAASEQAVARLYKLKRRESKPGTVIAASIDQLVALGIPRRALSAVEHFWPNPLSVVVPDSPNLRYIDRGMGSLAVRIPKNAELRELLMKTGPLLTSSANLTGKQTAETIEEAIAYFGEGVGLYVDGGVIAGIIPSTLIRVLDDTIEIIRKGAYTIDGQ